MKLSILVITAREDPGLEWLAEGLIEQQKPGDEIEIIIVDFHQRAADALLTDEIRLIGCVKRARVVTPKPTPWQGPHRLTSRDYAAIANARNTALCLATYDYVAFLDDRARLGPEWLAAVRRAEKSRASVVAGPCHRGRPGEPLAIDARLNTYRGGGRTSIPPHHLYGGNMCMPLAWALEVGGFEEETDPVGGQDAVMGQMLINCYHRLDFDASMAVIQDRRIDGLASDPDMHPFPRGDKGFPPKDKRGAVAKRYAERTRTTHASELVAQRDRVQGGQAFSMHDATASTLDWFDRRPIREM